VVPVPWPWVLANQHTASRTAARNVLRGETGDADGARVWLRVRTAPAPIACVPEAPLASKGWHDEAEFSVGRAHLESIRCPSYFRKSPGVPSAQFAIRRPHLLSRHQRPQYRGGTGESDSGSQTGQVVKLAGWSDDNRTSLAPHKPEPTEVIIVLEQGPDDAA
jgi:hypothetical protein